jgi:hypothetical protein
MVELTSTAPSTTGSKAQTTPARASNEFGDTPRSQLRSP